ncbi:dTDP-4-dehydrorhamnose reductase [Lutimaribacter saemankumensis]|uniref:dTDP-4-dehydrorhamnose reductase n=1 Tax=Lutimaribacter saemankumensis TaxID=490829 RepID=A0A1G8QYR0_9RHOB|nr:dTDP-4-dehydrorhamnose reductase [Lutimaribacter saemankumensis]SDJ09801.1 dTDP-4-dehydrorhamnose reductase [Lutimaribacter saemankumensis]
MTILVFGQTGQVAQELQEQADVLALGRDQADLSDPGLCAEAIRRAKPDVVINAAAYTAVDRAEQEEALATVVNGESPGAMARVCADLGIPFLHVSTDYVFDGSGSEPWRESDPVAPQNAYGRSKLAGEEAVRAAGGAHVILRTSWVFSAHGANFVKTMLRLSETRDALNVVDDQIGGPTPADAIAAALLEMAAQMQAGKAGGTYHFSGHPAVSWAGFAREIFSQARRDVSVTGIPSSEYPTPAARPLNSRLDCAKIRSDFGITPPDWTAGLARVLRQLECSE